MQADDQCHAKKQTLCPSSSSHAIEVGRQSHYHSTHSRNISTPNCLSSNLNNERQEDNSNSMTTLVLPIGSPDTSSSLQNQLNNHIESQSEYKQYVK